MKTPGRHEVEQAKTAVRAYFDFHRYRMTPESSFAWFGGATPRKRGRHHPHANWLRDVHIAEAIALVMRLGFRAQRNQNPIKMTDRKESACSIVCQVLKDLKLADIGEAEVEKIWEKFAPRIGLRARGAKPDKFIPPKFEAHRLEEGAPSTKGKARRN